ncbi:fungal-specific transcription factor domain-domain-containing protein [Aspergillus welwitschiae]|uniref:Fungal-specific transcription factor domain-domain-containing protein n=1 Tax=Aspergillus welwitschiae TaxID=1341132 RepID=A0A3F3PQG0_9EURO|nr:fungal-specific transcription factor domain-domain-containing protein [Aspergillus welwitschiae]RDH28566.1 fungal-specific transcription factor domain-domain-containing protein [Aspergillus welwitschiae]
MQARVPESSPTPEGDRYVPLRRTARACDSCHRRKIQCDTSVPCNWCRHHNLDCTFDRPVGGNKRKKTTQPANPRRPHQEDLEDRVRKLEELLTRSISTTQHPRNCLSLLEKGHLDTEQSPSLGESTELPIQTNTSGPSSGLLFGKIHFAGHYVGEIRSYSGIPCFSESGHEWVRSCTGEPGTFEDVWSHKYPNQVPYLTTPHPQNGYNHSVTPDLPDRSLVEQYVSHFFTSFERMVFPVVDEVLFRDTVELAYRPCQGPPPKEYTRARACIFAFLAFIAELDPSPSLPPLEPPVYAAKAQSLLPYILHDVSVPTLQTMVMHAIYRTFTGELQLANQFHSMACRVMFMLGGETGETVDAFRESSKDPEDRKWRSQRMLRRLFWICYGFDKEICFRSGQPPVIHDEYCDLTLPPNYTEIQYPSTDGHPIRYDDMTIPIFPGDLRLSMLKSKTYRTLYSAQALRKSDAQLLQDIRELDDELEQWRLNVPPGHRPTLGSFHEKQPIPVYRMQPIVIRLEYHYMMCTIHRASGRCDAWGQAWRNCKTGMMEGVNSSMLLAVEASRSSLHFLRTVISSVRPEAFWMIIFYPMSAILTIFCSILANPLDPYVEEDLHLLTVVPDLVRDVRRRRTSEVEIAHMQTVTNFVAELIRLGHCAIDKARRSQRQLTQP